MFKVTQTAKENRVVGNIRGDGELEMLLNEIPHMISLDHLLHHQNNHHLHSSVSPVSSCSSSGVLSSSEDGFSPFVAQMNQSPYRTPSTRYLDSVFANNSNEYMLDELALCDNLRRMKMNIGEAHKDYSQYFRRFPIDPDGLGFGFDGRSLERTNRCIFENNGTFEGFRSDVRGYEGFQSPTSGNSLSSGDDRKAKIFGLSHLTHNQSNGLYSEPSGYKDRIDYVMDQRKQQGRGSCNGGFRKHNPSLNRPYLNDESAYSRRRGMDFYGDSRSLLSPVNNPSQLMNPNRVFSSENPIICDGSMLKEKSGAIPKGEVPSARLPVTQTGDIEAFSCEDSLIIQGRSLKCVVSKGSNSSEGQKKKSHNETTVQNGREKRQELLGRSQLEGICEKSLSPMHQPCGSVAQLQGYICIMAQDQHGCRFLQKILDEATLQDVQIIFNEIINHVLELVMNPFGNYVVQRLLELCSEEQRMQIVLMVTEEPGELVRISLNTHGTRVVQKLIETLKTRQQISLVVLALEPGFLYLSKDLNGNHVIQRCLQCLSGEDNEFIFAAAAKFCIDIATHKHGCCVLNQCIAQSVGKYQEKLIAEIAAHGLLLAQDAFGAALHNIGLSILLHQVCLGIVRSLIPSAAASLISQFEGHYVYLSMQKFSSHVVQKCLKYFEESRPRIIHEFLSVPCFDQLLQDPFANYVIQSALDFSKGPLRALLVEAVRPHTILRTSPYCKKIFSHNLLQK